MKIYALNTLAIGKDTITLLMKQLNISGIIGLSERSPTDVISDYEYQKSFCEEHRIEFVEVANYSLNADADKTKLLSLDIDLLIVAGWQRLIPDWLIRHCKIAAVGAHGSPFGITKGRGRSPQNWALIMGEKEFYISIFKIDEHIDSGDIIDTAKFTLTPFDDIRSSYYKAAWLTANMIAKNIKNGNIGNYKSVRQDETDASYFPQRLPEDGHIDWNSPGVRIYNFVRALTKPYPGAFCKIGENIIKIWHAIPFEVDDITSARPGEIVKIFNKGELLVKTGDSFLLVKEYETAFPLAEGMVFESFPFSRNIERIVSRHRAKYPELKVSDEILKLAGTSSINSI